MWLLFSLSPVYTVMMKVPYTDKEIEIATRQCVFMNNFCTTASVEYSSAAECKISTVFQICSVTDETRNFFSEYVIEGRRRWGIRFEGESCWKSCM